MTINEKFLKLSSRIPYPQELILGQDITVVIGSENYIFNCVKTEDMDNQDGTINRIYTLKSLTE